MTTEEVKDASGHSLTVLKFRGRRLPAFPVEAYEGLDAFEFRDDDIVILSYPKSGTHWLWEITRTVQEGTTDLPVTSKGVTMLEWKLQEIESLPSPRILNTHMLYDEMPMLRKAKCKLVYIHRNPRDVAVSYYHHHRKLKEFYHYDGEWKDYFHLFVDGELDYGSWFDYTRDWERVIDTESHPPLISLSYEDLKENPVAEVKRLSQFLGKSHDDAFIQSVCDKCDFASMRQRVGGFVQDGSGNPVMFRKGQVGDWQNHFTPEQVARMQEVYENKMAGSSHVVRYTLEKQ